jgi:molybdopterin converting factor small subunit
MLVKVLAFGPIAEALGGREHQIELPVTSSARFLIEEIGMEMWLGKGLAISLNGRKVDEDAPLSDGDEIALLPPVSGG